MVDEDDKNLTQFAMYTDVTVDLHQTLFYGAFTPNLFGLFQTETKNQEVKKKVKKSKIKLIKVLSHSFSPLVLSFIFGDQNSMLVPLCCTDSFTTNFITNMDGLSL